MIQFWILVTHHSFQVSLKFLSLLSLRSPTTGIWKDQSFIAVGASSILTFLDVCAAAIVLIQLELFLEEMLLATDFCISQPWLFV